MISKLIEILCINKVILSYLILVASPDGGGEGRRDRGLAVFKIPTSHTF